MTSPARPRTRDARLRSSDARLRSSDARLRSSAWLAGDDEVALANRVALASAGVPVTARADRPVIGIANSASQLNPCNLPLRDLVEPVRAGIEAAGGVAAEFPVISLGEDLMKPTAMLYRNLLAIEIEETIRANPLDGIVLLANCDKSVPGALMGAISANVPTVLVTGGSRPVPTFRGAPVGSGTSLWRLWDERRAGRLDDEDWSALEQCLACGGTGACNTMGTASTMAVLSEVLGFMVPGASSIPAGDPRSAQAARQAGELAVRAVRSSRRPQQILTASALRNAIVALNAAGGSTNAVIHLAALAGRAGVPFRLDDLASIGAKVPVLADVEPSGVYLMRDFDAAGGVPALLSEVADLLDPDALTVSGKTISEIIQAGITRDGITRDRTIRDGTIRDEAIRDEAIQNRTIRDGTIRDGIVRNRIVRNGDECGGGSPRAIRAAGDPLRTGGAFGVVRGSLAPDGAVIKTSAATERLLRHRGPAIVFRGYHDMLSRIDDPDLPVTPDSVLVLAGCGPIGGIGMPEWGMIPIPARLVAAGVTDMVRVTDARMSGTSFGTVLLHVAPEAAAGGPLALVKDGDLISIDVPAGTCDLEVSDTELARRRAALVPWASPHLRGWPALYVRHVTQAPQGCDLDFLTAPTAAHREFIEPVVGRS
jgi:dihydroxy-acid dehydratase